MRCKSKRIFFGRLSNGRETYCYEIGNDELCARISDLGATLVSLKYRGKQIVCGFDNAVDYEGDDSHQGAIIGRVANRIAGARFVMNGVEYTLPRNDGDNCLHGGCGFDRRVWDVNEHKSDSISLHYRSADGEEGFPAEVTVDVKYTVIDSAMCIEYRAVPSGKTPIALTNHSYFNLNRIGTDVLDHEVTIYADRYTAVNEQLIPTGERPQVGGTPFDLHRGARLCDIIGKELDGFDHNFILDGSDGGRTFLGSSLPHAARVCCNGLALDVYTDQPGIQLYTGNFLGNGRPFYSTIPQVKHGALCLEAQTEPNSVNRGECFYDANEEYRQTTVYALSEGKN